MNNRTIFALFEQEMSYSQDSNGWDRFLRVIFLEEWMESPRRDILRWCH
jgi:hypothetical protein